MIELSIFIVAVSVSLTLILFGIERLVRTRGWVEEQRWMRKMRETDGPVYGAAIGDRRGPRGLPPMQ